MTSQHDIQVLIRLGLTCCQAKVYLALVQSGTSTVKSISEVSKVARPDIYSIMDKLQKLALAEKIIDTPVRFKANPIQEGISILLNHKIKNVSEASQEAKELIKKFKGREAKKESQEDEKQFVLVPKKEAAFSRRRKQIEAALTSIDAIGTFNRLRPLAFAFQEVTKKALERGVKIRVITEKPENENERSEIIQDFEKNPSFKLRYILNSPLAVVTIYDGKEILVTTSALTDLGESPALWSNNPSLLAMINDFYEIMWITAIENQQEEPNYKLSFPAQMHV